MLNADDISKKVLSFSVKQVISRFVNDWNQEETSAEASDEKLRIFMFKITLNEVRVTWICIIPFIKPFLGTILWEFTLNLEFDTFL